MNEMNRSIPSFIDEMMRWNEGKKRGVMEAVGGRGGWTPPSFKETLLAKWMVVRCFLKTGGRWRGCDLHVKTLASSLKVVVLQQPSAKSGVHSILWPGVQEHRHGMQHRLTSQTLPLCSNQTPWWAPFPCGRPNGSSLNFKSCQPVSNGHGIRGMFLASYRS